MSKGFGRRRRRGMAGTAVVLMGAGALVTGCGGGGSNANASKTGSLPPLVRAADVSNGTQGEELTINGKITSSALSTPITISGSGTVDKASRSGKFSFTLGGLPTIGSLALNEVITSTTIYVQLPPQLASLASSALGGKSWIKIGLQQAGVSSGSLAGLSNPATADPSQYLTYLRGVGAKVTNLGTATVVGRATTHYRATIDLSTIVGKLPPADRAAASAGIAALEKSTGSSTLPIDVWVDGQSLIRQMELNLDLHASGSTSTVNLTIEIPSYGPQPAPSPPPAGDVVDASALSGLLGGASSSTGSGQTTT